MQVYNQAKRHEGRNGRIFQAWAFGATQEAIAEEFDMSIANVRRILKQVEQTSPQIARDELRLRLTEAALIMSRSALEIYNKPAPPITSGKDGNVVYDPDTGEVARDYSAKIRAGEYWLKIVDRLSKLAGADMPVQHEVTVAAGQAAIEQAE